MIFHKQFLNAPIIIPRYETKQFDQELQAIFPLMKALHAKEKLVFLCKYFLNKPYTFEPLGEGINGEYYQEPLYRSDTFDCVTYVNTILSLYFSEDFEQFQKNMLSIRYRNHVHYTQRTDWFTDLEWIPQCQKLSWITDAMSAFNSVQEAKTIIDKPNWYQLKTWNALHLIQNLSAEHAEQLLLKLRNEGQQFKPCESSLSYISLQDLFNFNLFTKLPTISIIFIVRPNWPIRDQFQNYPQGYGTNLNVSHLGFNIKDQAQNWFYHASSVATQSVCLPLEDYLREFINSKTVKGIHIEEISI